MKKNKKVLFASSLLLGVGALAGAIFATNNSGVRTPSLANTLANKMVIDKKSNATGGKVTARTEKGNTSVFSYNRFDTRDGDTAYNNCICFYKVNDGVGGYITNDVALASIKTVSVYAYSTSDPYSSKLATAEFNLYYGYESLIVNESNDARVNFTTGTYTFEDGLEPSFIALEVRTTFDYCVSRVEIEYLCEPVVGKVTEQEGPAYKYDYVGKSFETAGGKEVPYNITERAPWARVDLSKATLIQSTSSINKEYNSTLTVDENGASLTGYYNAGISVETNQISNGRGYISFTVKLGAWKWNGPCVYFRLYRGTTENGFQVYNSAGVTGFINAGGKIYNASGLEVTSLNTTDFFTFEINASKLAGEGNITKFIVWSGYDSDDSPDFANVPTTIVKDITFKETLCGCPTSKAVAEEFSNGIQTGTRCAGCGKVISTLVTKTEKSVPSGKDNVMTVETGVEFEGRKDCLKTTTTALTTPADMGYSMNYKVYYRNLVANARAAGKPIIKLNLYVSASRNDNIRFGWGVGNNTSGAQADHYNNPVVHVGTNDVANNSTITDENGSAAKMVANQWRVITLDVSGDFYADINDLYICGNFPFGSYDFEAQPLSTYVSNVRCEAKAA